jgi:hypothetical protein
MRHVILDTDIGTDVDDMLALVFLAKATELCIEGVTTVHGKRLYLMGGAYWKDYPRIRKKFFTWR